MYIYLWSYIFVKLEKIIALSFLNTSPVIVLIVYSENVQPQVPLGQRGSKESKRISMASSLFLILHLGTSSWPHWPRGEDLELWSRASAMTVNKPGAQCKWLRWAAPRDSLIHSLRFTEVSEQLPAFSFLFLQPAYWILPRCITPTLQIHCTLF